MPQNINIMNMNFQPGMGVKVTGDIPPNPQRFRINLGSDEDNIGLHFNPRFNYLTDKNIIILNTRKNGKWGEEQRDSRFPYMPETTVEVLIIFGEKEFKVKLPDGSEIVFPNRLELENINFMSISDDLDVKKIDFDLSPPVNPASEASSEPLMLSYY